MSKFKIYEFDPVIYPRTLWVAKGGTQEDIKGVFLDSERNEINFGDRDDVGAWTCDVIRKEDMKYGVAVWFPYEISINYMAHEATHAMFFLAAALGLENEDATNNEHFAYLMGWICDCIDKVRTNKIKN